MIRRDESYDIVVCGGGLAGLCAAIAAARLGRRTCLVHDRPVLGGNASSEVRVTVHGAACFHSYARETGIIAELLAEERARNHETITENGWTNSVFDLVLYDWAVREPNLSLRLNTAVHDLVMDGCRMGEKTERRPPAGAAKGYLERPACNPSGRIEAVVVRVANAETDLTIAAPIFIDCTGDAVVADLAGCSWRLGAEPRAEYGEPHAPEHASAATMGSSLHFHCRDLGRPVPFSPPAWAVRYDDPDFFYRQGRPPTNPRGGYWWIELGAPWDTIRDNETLRHELTRHVLGIWDWMKNRDPVMRERCANHAMDWIGQVPGKRESRRVLGRHVLTETEIQARTVFADEIAYGGWFIDLHTTGGLLAPTSEPTAAKGYAFHDPLYASGLVGPYGIPLGVCISRDVENLLVAGRNVSVSRAALGSLRVMGTTALLGQAAGTCAALAVALTCSPGEVGDRHCRRLQQSLLRQGCFLPNVERQDPEDIAPRAVASASSSARCSGIGPWDPCAISSLRRHPAGRRDPLERPIAQWIASAGSVVDALGVCLSNRAPMPRDLPATLSIAEHIWDYRVDSTQVVARTVLSVPPGQELWVEWPVGLRDLPTPCWLRLDLGPCGEIEWHIATGLIMGHVSAVALTAAKLRQFSGGLVHAFRIDPPQPCFGAEQVLAGAGRPYRSTGCWRSDPGRPLPQHLALTWSEPQDIGVVELRFPGNLVEEVHAAPPFHRDPQIPRDYRIEALTDGSWTVLHEERGNYHNHRCHTLASPVQTAGLRIQVLATNGDPSAAIAAVRVHPPGV